MPFSTIPILKLKEVNTAKVSGELEYKYKYKYKDKDDLYSF